VIPALVIGCLSLVFMAGSYYPHPFSLAVSGLAAVGLAFLLSLKINRNRGILGAQLKSGLTVEQVVAFAAANETQKLPVYVAAVRSGYQPAKDILIARLDGRTVLIIGGGANDSEKSAS
jgi:hypothetical protein